MQEDLRVAKDDIGEDLDAYYWHDIHTVLINEGIPKSTEKARRIEACGYQKHPPKSGRKACHRVRDWDDLDEQSISAMRRVVDSFAPEDVEAVLDARRISGDPRWISAFKEIDVQLVVAIMANLNEREVGYSGL